MRIKIVNEILLIDILVAILIITITFVPINILRIILGLPFILFFPGYTLIAAIFTGKERFDILERLALSLVLSISLVVIVGLAFNFATWGINLLPTLYAISVFIAITSLIALIRRSRLDGYSNIVEIKLKLPIYISDSFNKVLSITLAIFILISLGILGYTVAAPKIGEHFSDFYILGLNGQAQAYPTEFIVEKDRVVGVTYGTGIFDASSEWGKITIGIVNHEQQKISYTVILRIDGNQISMNYDGKSLSKLENIELAQGEKWEHQIGFAPQYSGENQNLEIQLYSADNPSFMRTLNLWIKVKYLN